jgi:ribosomal protein RSM22 (predicted rRNA methylase)
VSYPGQLDEIVAHWLAANRGGSQRASAQKLQAAYRAGSPSSADDLAAYMTARLPATFAANQRVMAELRAIMPQFAPASVLDCGAGPGTATWAALAQWSSVADVQQLEALQAFCELAQALNAESGLVALQHAKIAQANIRTLPSVTAELVLASYVLAELPEDEASHIARELWSRTDHTLIVIEPGTPLGFARVRKVRDALRGQGHVIAPCTQAEACPISGDDWCHFKVRLSRTREHMHAKAAQVPFEDEAFSYIVVSRHPQALTGARIVAPVNINKVNAELRLCDVSGLHTEMIASRDKPAYKRAKKARWGDVWSDAL